MQIFRACLNSSKDSDDENVFSFQPTAKPIKSFSVSPPNVKLEPLTGQEKKSNADRKELAAEVIPSESCGSSVVAMPSQVSEIIFIQESQPLFEDCSETYCDKLELKLQEVESVAKKAEMNENENIVASHNRSCRQCSMVSACSFIFFLPKELIVVLRYWSQMHSRWQSPQHSN